MFTQFPFCLIVPLNVQCNISKAIKIMFLEADKNVKTRINYFSETFLSSIVFDIPQYIEIFIFFLLFLSELKFLAGYSDAHLNFTNSLKRAKLEL
jgi:hypothetical protein